MKATLLITGATRGLGLETARAAARANRFQILVAGRNPTAVERVASEVGGTPVVLDLATLGETRAAVAGLPPINLLAANAGLQIPGPRTETADGLEETVQVNHLAHLMVIDALIEKAKQPMRIAMVGSATHDPAVRSGLPTPEDVDVATLIAGRGDNSANGGRRRYATSKLLVTAAALGLAREQSSSKIYLFDPGLMPGTGLARQYSGWQRTLWSTAMRALTVMPFASTPPRSGRVLAGLLIDDPALASGSALDHRKRPAAVSVRAADPDFQDEVLRVSRELVAGSLAQTPG